MTIRFFTSLMLRVGEEIDASLIPWLERSATVEFAEGLPVTGVWQHADGLRRVCWYAEAPSAAIRDAHAERYGDEPYWILHRKANDAASVEVFECDRLGGVVARRLCSFDGMGLLATEHTYRPSGELSRTRTYKWMMNGLALRLQESEAPAFQQTTRWRVPEAGIPELSAEAFPRGGTLDSGAVRLLGLIARNQYQARCHAVYRRDGIWTPAIATLATMTRSALVPLGSVLDLAGDRIAPLVAQDKLARVPMEPGYTFYGIVEALPPGRTVQDVVIDHPLDPPGALRVALQIGDVARQAHAKGVALGGIRPELVYLRDRGADLQLSAIMHRAPAFLRATYCGEAHLVPQLLAEEFQSHDDVAGLAQLLWFMVTGDHPIRARADIAWDGNGEEHPPSRQAWRGPVAWEPLLERCLFGNRTTRPSLDQMLSELAALVDAGHPYR